MNSKISIVIPCYNEMITLEDGVSKILNVLKKLKLDFELILIDDFSTDGTRNIYKDVVKIDKRINYYLHNHNEGRGKTVRDGILKAKGDIVGYLDIDLEVSEKYIPKFIKKIQDGNDMAIALRHFSDESSIIRFVASKTYVSISRIILSSNFKDTEAGYKFFNRKSILPVLKETKNNHWFWDTEIIMRAKYKGLKICEIPVIYKRRIDKKSTVKLFRDSFKYLLSLLVFKLEVLKNQ